MKLGKMRKQLWHTLLYLCRKTEDIHIKTVGNHAKFVAANLFLETVLLYFSTHLEQIPMSVAVAAYATKIPLISLALQVLICMSA
jgi:hypothetical protein